MTYALCLFLAIAAAPCIYVVMAFRTKRPETFAEYHYAGRTIAPADYVSSTIAYALQVAVLTLFATWGYQYGFWTISVAIFWGIGYLVLASLVKRGTIDRFLRQDRLGTIHQFLGVRSHIRALALIAALVSLMGIAGPAMFEAHFVANISSRLIVDIGHSEDPDSLVAEFTALFFWAFVVLAAIYMLYGGYRTIVRTDGIQLSIGYGAFSVALSLLLIRVAKTHSPEPALILLSGLFLLSVVAAICWRFLAGRQQRPARKLVVGGGIVLPLVSYAVGLAVTIVGAGGIEGSAFGSFFAEQQFSNPLALGGMTLLNLLIANALYQFVDVGQWQRLGSVSYDTQTPDKSRAAIAGYLRSIAVFTVISWIVAICFGMALRYVSADMSEHAFDELAAYMLSAQQSTSGIDKTVVILLLVAVGAVMFSTLDSLVAAIAFTAHNDVLRPREDGAKQVLLARAVTFTLLVISGLLYLWAYARVETFAEILYASWSMQIGLFWVIVLSFTNRPLSPIFAVLSVVAGIAGAITPLAVGAPLTTYSHGAIFALLASGLVAVAGVAFPTGRLRAKVGAD